MKKLLCLLALLACLPGCARQDPARIAATTLPVYEFTARLCENTPLTVTRLVDASVSCLHDYSLNVRQVRAAEAAECIVLSGGGLEDFMADLLTNKAAIDASAGIELRCPEESHGHDHEGHRHEEDPHIWLDPRHAMTMAENICAGLSQKYPQYREAMEASLASLLADLESLDAYGQARLSRLSCRELLTFHDGFSYLAEGYGLTILEAVEEESGSEASAKELIHLITLTQAHALPAIFTEKNGAASASGIIARETGARVFALDMAMAGDSYFDAMYHNFDTIKEALS